MTPEQKAAEAAEDDFLRAKALLVDAVETAYLAGWILPDPLVAAYKRYLEAFLTVEAAVDRLGVPDFNAMASRIVANITESREV